MLDTKAGSGEGERADLTKIAKQGFEALVSGEGKFFAGPMKTKVQGRSSQILPEAVTAAAHRGLAEPGTANEYIVSLSSIEQRRMSVGVLCFLA